MFLEAVGITVLCVDRDGGSRSTIASTEGMTGAVIDRAAVWQQAFERHQQPAGSARSSMTYPDEGPHPRHSTAGRRRIVVSSRGRAGAIVPPGDFRSGLVDALDDQAFIEPWCDR